MISIVVPIYKELDSITAFLESVLPRIENYKSELIFVMDPSGPLGLSEEDLKTRALLESARSAYPQIKLLVLSRRFGQASSIRAGLNLAKGDAVIVMDVDLQDPPHLIPLMIEKWNQGYDVVLPRRISRQGEPLSKKITAGLGYRVISYLTDGLIPENVGDFRLLSKRAVQHLLSLPERHSFLRGTTALIGFEQVLIPYERPHRLHGSSRYNRFFGSIEIGLNGIFPFTKKLFRIQVILGIFALSLALGVGILSFRGMDIQISNFGLLGFMFLFFGLSQLSHSLLGAYARRTYQESLHRPTHIINSQKSIGLDDYK